MRHLLSLACLALVLVSANAYRHAQDAPAANRNPLRVGIVGLVHGHVQGFFEHSLHDPAIELVGIAEPDQAPFARYSKQFGIDQNLFFPNLEEMLTRTHPQAVLVYTNTYDHRRVVEICARHGVHVMMEKP
ncbi:MAG: Gfo/Idh/MocA family oxidoreductase, partial [Candidatus Sulfotelmatobacter sp.]